MQRLLPLLLLLGAAWGCAHRSSLIVVDTHDHEATDNPDEAERKANEALKDIERRVQSGDLPKIQFEFDKDIITPESYPTLNLVAQVLLADEHLKLTIFAHADIIGTDDYNVDLSRRRAKSVKSYLASKGVPPPSMRFHGYGSSKPIADNATDEGRAKNRRVEFYVTTREWKSVY
jgi:outer membrane protein OmpA-like peptidoglycan-associated protein